MASTRMHSYRCYFINHDAHHGGPAEIVDADNLSAAIDVALAMLRARPHYASIELWDGAKRVYPTGSPNRV